jgi:F-type H+-transporting ATPase subunit gamma
VVRAITRFAAEHPDKTIKLYIVGKNAYDFFKKKDLKILDQWIGLGGKITYLTAQRVSDVLTKAFTDGEFEELYVAYNVFKSTAYQVPTVEKLLPLAFETEEQADNQAEAALVDYIFEPAPEELLNTLLPKYVVFSIYHVMLESAAGEHGARMVAMDNATRSANDMLKRLMLNYNKARQAAITTDLLDIVNGAEALK